MCIQLRWVCCRDTADASNIVWNGDGISKSMEAKRSKQHMDMVRHHDERGSFVSLPIEISQCIGHDPGQCRILQDAGSTPLIQPVLDPSRKTIMVAFRRLSVPRPRMVFQSESALLPPQIQFGFGN